MIGSVLRSSLRFDWYIAAMLLMVALGLLFPAQGDWRPVLDMVAYWAVWLLFFLYGVRLSMGAVWQGLLHWRLQGMVVLSTFVFMPLLGLAMAAIVSGWLQPDLLTGLIFLALLPSTVQSSVAFTAIARGNVPAALCAASISNLLGVAITPLLASILLDSAYGFSAEGLEKLLLQLVLPFILGQFARPALAAWLAEHRLLTLPCDRGSILIIVYSAFSAGTVAGIWSLVSAGDLALLLGVTLLMLAIVLLATRLAARRSGFSVPDEIVIVFCGSKKSLASGLPMAKVLFAGPEIGLIMLPVMIFHQAQLIVCAVLARIYASREYE